MSDDIIFDGSEDIEDWESVDTVDPEEQDFNDFDKEFIDMDEVEEGDYWVGEYTSTYQFDGAQSASVLFDNTDEEITYAFPDHAMLLSQLSDTELSETQQRVENPVESGETVAIVYQGTKPVDGRPMDMHLWELRRPKQ